MGVNQSEPLLMSFCTHVILVTSATFLIMIRISIVDKSNDHNYPDKG